MENLNYEQLSSDLDLSEGGIKRMNSHEPIVLSMTLYEKTKEDYVRELGGAGCEFIQSFHEGG